MNTKLKSVLLSCLREALRAGGAALLAALGLSVSGCAAVPFFIF